MTLTSPGRRTLVGLLVTAGTVLALVPGPASADDRRYLADLRPVTASGGVDTGSANVNGTTYVHSSTIAYLDSKDEKGSVEYDLGRRCSQLTLTQGLRDDSDPSAQVLLEILGDGVTKHSAVSRLGAATPVTLDVAGVLRLRLQTTVLASTRTYSTMVLGDAAITCSGVTPARITAVAGTTLVASGAPVTLSGAVTDVGGSPVPAAEVHVLGRRSGNAYSEAGLVTTDAAGRWSLVVRPEYSTRYAVQTEDGSGRAVVRGDTQPLITVRGAVTLAAQRLGTRSYRFYGRVSPAVSDKTVTLYRRSGGRDVLVSRTTTNYDGTYTVHRDFSGNGRFTFVVRTGSDGYSTGAVSNARPTAVL